jgi:hypothetical protein
VIAALRNHPACLAMRADDSNFIAPAATRTLVVRESEQIGLSAQM